MQASLPIQDVPGLEGPDYVSLVIEWNDDDDAATLVGAEDGAEPNRASTTRTIVAVLGALGALFLAAWGLRRLRAA
jgi:hypothetical protein